MNIGDVMESANRRSLFVTPLAGENLLDAEQRFPRDELLRRVLSTFWRDCCCPLTLSRAPAPVIELESGAALARRRRAWWLLNDGIVEDCDGAYSERLQLFFGGPVHAPGLAPRYEFHLSHEPVAVTMAYYKEHAICYSYRVRLRSDTNDTLCVIGQQPWTVRQ